jgi:hypothetical protein
MRSLCCLSLYLSVTVNVFVYATVIFVRRIISWPWCLFVCLRHIFAISMRSVSHQREAVNSLFPELVVVFSTSYLRQQHFLQNKSLGREPEKERCSVVGRLASTTALQITVLFEVNKLINELGRYRYSNLSASWYRLSHIPSYPPRFLWPARHISRVVTQTWQTRGHTHS